MLLSYFFVTRVDSLLQVMLPLLPQVAKWPISRALYVKDYSQVRNPTVCR